MRFPLLFLLPLFALCLPHTLPAGDGKQQHAISFHIEGSQQDGPGRVFSHMVLGQERFFRLSPEITHTDFQAVLPFRSEEGDSFGAVFALRNRAKSRLSQITGSMQGSYIMVVVDGIPADYMLIDQQVDDGVLVIWRNLTNSHLEFFEKSLKLPRLDPPEAGP